MSLKPLSKIPAICAYLGERMTSRAAQIGLIWFRKANQRPDVETPKVNIHNLIPSMGIIVMACFGLVAGCTSKPSAKSYCQDLEVRNYLILTPDWISTEQRETYYYYANQAAINFNVRNSTDQDIELSGYDIIGGLALLDQAGKPRWIDDFIHPGVDPFDSVKLMSFTVSLPDGWHVPSPIILKPGETRSFPSPTYDLDILDAVKSRKIFGVVRGGRVVSTGQLFSSYSAPFLLPPALTTPPWNDLGEQNYLSIEPNLAELRFFGGNFRNTTANLQRADPQYDESIKNGFTEDVMVPFVIKNTSSQNLVAVIDDIGYYIAGKETAPNAVTRREGSHCLETSRPALKPGESISYEGQWSLRLVERKGYKAGDKIIAVVYGRIANTNNIFECYSAPFELPPLPKGE